MLVLDTLFMRRIGISKSLGAPSLFLLAVLGLAAPAGAEPPQRTTSLVVYGDDPCPKGEGDEIVVCARKPEGERYRIPKPLRNPRRTDGPSTAWGSRWADVEDQTRFTRPNGCSPVGSYGQTGCTAAMLHQWWIERQASTATKP